MFDELPSESPRRRRLLYLAEGLLIGTGGTYLLISFGGLIGSFASSPPTIGMVLFLLFGLLLAFRFLWALHFDRQAGFRPTKSRVEKDWSATREWRWVALTSALAGGLVFGVSVYVWGWEEVIYYYGGVEVFSVAIFLGLGLWAYGLYDRSNSE